MGAVEAMMKFGVSDIITVSVLVLSVLGYFFEISRIKIKPLSALGRLLNRETILKVDRLNERLVALQEKQEESEIKAARMRIQRFADEMYGEVRHSKEHFDLILMDITAYNNYCESHPGFINEKTKVAQDVICEKYEKCLRERSFRG